ncbi:MULTISPECIES: hypothetical protein [unclassified Streptomyces]|uniref:hypothetical protein n=1 Tax=unclassified Streptomyces TaxID=2593676 RepID=UPI002E0E7C88|nr:hypothetical protein OG395_52420 [Streptomyces sp. NBC_01320]
MIDLTGLSCTSTTHARDSIPPWVSTDQQSTVRQNLVLAEAGIEDPMTFKKDGGTSSRLHPLQRPKFGKLLTYARPGDTVHSRRKVACCEENDQRP